MEDVARFVSWVSENPTSLICIVPVVMVAAVIVVFLFLSGAGMGSSLNE